MNPFRETIVASPWEATRLDIPEIHDSVFDQCLQGLAQVRADHRSAGLLIHGEAGSGKTHLLSRLRAELTPTAPIATDRAESLFVWVRLQTSPRMIWRTLRRTLAEDWFRPVADGRPQMDRILFHRLARIRPAEWDLEPWYDYMLDEDPVGLKECLDRIADDLHLDRNTAVAFEHLAFGRHRRDLRAWLAGTSLPDAALERLEMAREEGTEEELEDQARQVVLMLCRLTGPDLPILLSFDQVEALQTGPDDHDALFAFGQLASTLHDCTQNVFLVSCVQSAFATQLKDHARSADYDRMTSAGALSLDPLNRPQALQLIAGRLAAAGGEAETETTTRPGCWPLGETEFRELFSAGAVSPRKLLNLCAARFESPEDTSPRSRQQAEIADSLQQHFFEQIEQLKQVNQPDRTEEIIQHGWPLLVNLLAPQSHIVKDEELPDVALIFEMPQGRLGLSLCTQSSMQSLAARLKRLKSQFELNRLQTLVLIRDSRVPISPNARKAIEYLKDLENAGARTILPSVAALTALDALRRLISDARSGDLICEGMPVSPEQVREWLLAEFPPVLRDFADDVFAGASEANDAADASHAAESPEEQQAINALPTPEGMAD